MTNNIFIYLTFGSWIILVVYWIIQAKTNAQTSFVSELSSLVKLTVSAFIIYVPIFGWLVKELYSANIWINVLGIILCGVGVFFMVWARHILGKNWSGKVMIQEDHSLIKEAPYSLVRHPQYFGFLLALLGTTLVLGQLFSFIWFLLMVVSMIIKSKQEDKLLMNEFPNEYPDYKKKVKMLFPFIL